MSYSLLQARGEELTIINQAIKEDDDITLYLRAQRAKELGDDEYADMLLKLARRAQRNQLEDNQWDDERAVERAEMNNSPAEGF